MRCAAALLCLAVASSAEIVDRVAITVGRDAITELQLDEEVRVTAFLNRQPVVRDSDTRRSAANRLIEQLIITREMRVSRYLLPDEKDVDQYVEQIRSGFGGALQFDRAIARYGLNQDILRDHLALQLTTMRFIEYRFQPEIDVTESEIRSAYDQVVAASRAAHSASVPTLEASRESIRRALVEERIDRALDTWLEERRRRAHIVYVDASLQ